MEIRIYNQKMDFEGIIENQTSLIWTRKYYEPGKFEIHAPITNENLKLLKRGNLVWIRGKVEAAVIEDYELEQSSERNEITAKGRFLSSYIDRRLIKGTKYFKGKIEQAMRELIAEAEEIPGVQLGELHGYPEEIEFQATYKNLLKYEQKLAKSSGLGFRIRPDFLQKQMYFEVYKGIDRTYSQSENNRVVFSEKYGNVSNAIYRENDQLFRTVAIVGSAEEEGTRTFYTVGEGEGLELREIFIDANDIKKADLTEEQFFAALRTRGEEALAANAMSKSFEFETTANANFIYKENYDLGDLVTVKKESWGISENQRITEICEIYEANHRNIELTFGNPLPETIDWSDN